MSFFSVSEKWSWGRIKVAFYVSPMAFAPIRKQGIDKVFSLQL